MISNYAANARQVLTVKALHFLMFGVASTILISTSNADQGTDNFKERQAKAVAMFKERCKGAGEKIVRTVVGVEGVLLLKVRPESEETNYADQFRMNDPYGHDSAGDWYIKTFFLEPYLVANRYASAEMKSYIRDHYRGYRFVDAIDAKDGKRYRYTGRIDQPWLRDKKYGEWVREFVLDKVPAPEPAPRYGVTYDDISTHEEREYWIAGSSLRIVDLKTNEVIAERIGYMMDWGQGNRAGGRSPWLLAADNACPAFPGRPGSHAQQNDQTRYFVVKVLTPIRDD